MKEKKRKGLTIETTEQIVVQLVRGKNEEAILKQFDITKDELNIAKQKLVDTANETTSERIGVAIKRVDELYSLSKSDGDFTTSLASLKELAKLQGLYKYEKEEKTEDGENETVAMIEQYLDTTDIKKELPTHEKVRVLCERLRTAN